MRARRLLSLLFGSIPLALIACGDGAGPSSNGGDASAETSADGASDGADDASDGASDGAIDSTDDAITDADAADAPIPTGPVFYVATTGDDAADGSLARPWRTLGHAMSTVPAGATVYARGGVYGEKVQVRVSGTAGAPIVLASAPGEQAIVDGTGLTAIDQQGLIEIADRSHLVIRGLEIRNFKSSTAAVPVGIYVTGASVDVRLEGNDVHDVVSTVESCDGAGGNAFGVAIYGTATTPISQLAIVGNRVHHLRTGCSESVAINGNVDGFEVSGNDVHDDDNIGIVAIGAEGTAPTPALDAARNGVIRDNRVWNVSSATNPAYQGSLAADGIYVDGGRGILIERNVVHNCDIGIELASEHAGKATSYVLARDNLVYFCGGTGASMGGYDAQRGATDHCAFVNNTFYANEVELTLQYYVTQSIFRNNVSFDDQTNFVDGATTGLTIEHDLRYSTAVASVFVKPGSPRDGSVAVDLRLTGAALASSRDQGATGGCPSGWTCPALWGPKLEGTQDVAGSARTAGAAVDVGAYEAP